MSDQIKHECGIALIRLRKPLEHYRKEYGSHTYGLDNLYLMMEKQHNRGQEGAGVACIKLDTQPGNEYIFRERAMGTGAIKEVFTEINRQIRQSAQEGAAPEERPFIGEIYMGHLRYSTTGRSGISYTHPFLRRNNWQCRNLCLAGNFNLTNVDEIFGQIVADGQHPRQNADTFIILEQLGCMLDKQAGHLREKFEAEGLSGEQLTQAIERSIDLETIFRKASSMWDGGFVITGATGSGESFIFRDRWGIRPAFWYADEDVVVAASERAVIQTVLNVRTEQVNELEPGQCMIIAKDGSFRLTQLHSADHITPCSFERIYFSRGSDRDIYRERKTLGRLLTEPILDAVDRDIDHAVFSFIPNTAEVAWFGMMEGLGEYMNRRKVAEIAALKNPSPEQISAILECGVRTEKLAVKDIKLRTFITEGSSRNDLAAHVYDITYGTVTPGQDSIVVIDDSIVRGTTLRQSIIKILARLEPKRIVIVSSSPQVRYPDCYGIDMSSMGEFIAFNAAIELLQQSGRQSVIDEVYRKSKAQVGKPKEQIVNYVKDIYAPFTDQQITDQIASMLTPKDCGCEVRIVYQSIAGLHEACPANNGDWYFSGNYPTPGGNRLVNNAFVSYYEAAFPDKV